MIVFIKLKTLSESKLCGLAQLLYSSFGVEILLAFLPGKADDYTVIVVINISLVISDAQVDHTLDKNFLSGVQLFIGGVKSFGGSERNIYAALDINAEAYVVNALDVNCFVIAVKTAEAVDNG